MRLSLLAQILDLLCPRHCLICGQRLLGEEEIICIACNLHLPRTNTWQQPEDNDMAKLFWHSIPVEKCCALFHYHGHAPASNLLYQLKYNQHEEVGVGMGHLLANEALRIQFFDGIDAIVPIPLAPKRKKRARLQPERGHSARTARSHKDSHTQQARQKKDFRRKPDTQEPMGTQHQCAGCLCPVARLRTRRKQGRKPRTQTSAHRRRRVHNRSHHHFMLPGTHEGNRLDEVQHPHHRIRQRTISSKNK